MTQETLHNELVARRCALSEIRNTAYKIVAAVSAAGITLFWLLLTEYRFSLLQTITLSIFVIVLTCFVFLFLASLHNGFKKNRMIMVNIETQLGLHNGELFPSDYKSVNVKITDFMCMAIFFILFVAFAVIAISWIQYGFMPCKNRAIPAIQQEHNTSSANFSFSINAKEAQDFSIHIKDNHRDAR